MSGIQFFTDKNHTMTRQEIFPASFIAGAMTLEISEKPVNSGFMGCGAAITGASCYELNQMDEKERTELLGKIYSKEGLNLSVGRLSIGSSDYSAELYSYDEEPFDTQLKHFSIERDREYIIPMIKEILKVRPDLFLYASPWSPPGWMKTGGQMCGGYMRQEFVECYAEYMVKYIRAYAEEGIVIRAVTPQNEPETYQFSRMPACIWHPEIEAQFIKALRRKLIENAMDVEIWMYDHSFTGTERVLWTLRNTEGLSEACDGVAFHYYDGAIEETMKVREEYPELKLHFTEGGPRLYDHYDNDWCKWGIMASKALNYGYQSFTGWNLMLNECGGPNIGPFFCGGLVTRNRVADTLEYSGQYKAYQHIAPYVTPESEIYSVRPDGYYGGNMFQYPRLGRGVEGFMADNGEAGRALVLINPNEGKVQSQFRLDGRWWYAELLPESISTILL
ncbi:MAG TPA: hypothetical protein H9717_12620 [Candidatus Eisenbergiella merdipullorum]|uniref:Glycosyl hydrolase family 30 TIM-barrel domain-containing protein n=1 Tax=Candidatus Eisenbergiella merdipullorum TaxID=2838553 RepID=A0A9D2I7Z0_9FIRM|nr:hypothetical protein [Candidatus Eisenbergiella merdipullorum]